MKEIITDWCQFCESAQNFDKSHFYTLFWENMNSNNLKEIFKYFPNSDKLFELTNEYLFGKNEEGLKIASEDRLIELALNDVYQKKQLLDTGSELRRMLDEIDVRFVKDNNYVEELRNESPYIDFFDAVSDKLMDNWVLEDEKTYALQEAFYGLTKSYEMVWYLFSPLFSIDLNLTSYYKFDTLGGVYSFSNNTLIVSSNILI